MALDWADRVQETTTTAGTGALTLGGAVDASHQTFSVIGDGNTCRYCLFAVDGFGNANGVWEAGLGTYAAAGNTLARTEITANSSGTQVALDLAAGPKRVMLTVTAAHVKNTPVVNGGTGLTALGSALQVLRVNAGGTALEYATITSSPDAFVFTDAINQDVATVITSNTITLSGPSGVSDVWPVTVDGDGSPQVSINGGTWTDARVPAAVARGGDTLAVRLTSSSSNSTARTATVRVGGQSDVWSVTTAAWLPSAPGGLTVWLKADAGTGGVADSDPVTTWTDQSGNSNNPTQATGNKRPLYRTNVLNGLPVVRFDGSNDHLQLPALTGGNLAQPYTLALVYRLPAGSGGRAPFDLVKSDGSGGGELFTPAALSKTRDTKYTVVGTQLAVQALDPDWHILLYEVSGASSTVRLDNKPQRSLGTAAWTAAAAGLNLGAGWYNSDFTLADFAEVLLYDGTLTTDEKNSLFTYLNGRWGVLDTADAYAVVDDSANFNAFPGAEIAGNGDVVVTYRRGTGHVGDKGSIYLCRSTDDGVTWGTPAQIITDATYDLRDPVSLKRFASGRLGLTYFRYPVSGTPLTDVRSYYTYSDDDGVTWSSPAVITTPAGYDWLAVWGDLTELSAGGDLLVTAYGPKTATGRQDAVVMKSTDGGATWALQGVIAAGGAGPLDYTETYLVTTTSNSNLFAVIREDNTSSLYTATSSDGGATWSAVSAALVNGVAPHLLRADDGTLVLAWADRNVGPFGVSAMKSSDHGATWSTWRYRVWCRNAGEDMGYCALVETIPGVIGVASYLDSSGSQATIRWDTFRLASIQ